MNKTSHYHSYDRQLHIQHSLAPNFNFFSFLLPVIFYICVNVHFLSICQAFFECWTSCLPLTKNDCHLTLLAFHFSTFPIRKKYLTSAGHVGREQMLLSQMGNGNGTSHTSQGGAVAVRIEATLLSLVNTSFFRYPSSYRNGWPSSGSALHATGQRNDHMLLQINLLALDSVLNLACSMALHHYHHHHHYHYLFLII